MNITNNFTLQEFIQSATAQKYNIDNTPSNDVRYNIVDLCFKILQPIRTKYRHPITITSGYRCKELNDKVGGSKKSQHLTGQAADISVGDKTKNKKLFDMIVQMIEDKEITVGQLISEKNYTWIHISSPTETKKDQILHLK